MPLMHETSADAPWAAVQVFVVAPDGEVGAPIVQPQRNIPGGVREIEAYDASFLMPSFGDRRHIQRLTRNVVHASQQNERDRVSFPLNHRMDIFVAQASLIWARPKFEQR